MDPFELDGSSRTPPSEQLRVQVIERIGSGRLAAGARLPTVRALADELGVATNTVAKAYRELERDGFLETRGRSGSFVNGQGGAAEREAQAAARIYADRIRQLGVDASDARRYVEAALAD